MSPTDPPGRRSVGNVLAQMARCRRRVPRDAPNVDEPAWMEPGLRALAPSAGGSGTLLLSSAVAPTTKEAYKKGVTAFLLFVNLLGKNLASTEDIDRSFCAYFDECFLEGLGPSTGERLVAGWCDAFPEYRAGDFQFACRALRGWRRLRPSQSRHPLPWCVCAAAAALIALEPGKGLAMAVGVVLMFDGYLRPYELLGIRKMDVLAPAAGGFSSWAVILCPWTGGRPSKTKIFDDTIRLDTRSRPEVSTLLQALLASFAIAAPTTRLFDFSHAELGRAFSAAMDWLSLSPWNFTLYCCRHGGPSTYRASGERSMSDIQRRGRWQSDSSLRRYEQQGRLHVVLGRAPPASVKFCERCQAHLVDLVLNPRELKRPVVTTLYAVPEAAEYDDAE